ncbi:hypothetical protein POVWA2_035960 [Plasmodium ovale wallikeri]|uniref:Uncharacterized protein n=1 Tax=Plasmodium ovale wallikeri TaxID=864142 RepID=A0A1A8Z402_PLAOA|nr:hypothetical protein POVWA2_035960 [Plasmodium ovale wallikeri]
MKNGKMGKIKERGIYWMQFISALNWDNENGETLFHIFTKLICKKGTLKIWTQHRIKNSMHACNIVGKVPTLKGVTGDTP